MCSGDKASASRQKRGSLTKSNRAENKVNRSIKKIVEATEKNK